VRLDVATSEVYPLAQVGGRAFGLAVDDEHVYVPHLDGRVVWVVDRRHGRVVRTLQVGDRPIAVALVPTVLP
jgi:DNA-binding beta-propeller fold protein YncE